MLNDVDSEFEALGEELETTEYSQVFNDSEDDFKMNTSLIVMMLNQLPLMIMLTNC